jgi:hypothetical protein
MVLKVELFRVGWFGIVNEVLVPSELFLTIQCGFLLGP